MLIKPIQMFKTCTNIGEGYDVELCLLVLPASPIFFKFHFAEGSLCMLPDVHIYHSFHYYTDGTRGFLLQFLSPVAPL